MWPGSLGAAGRLWEDALQTCPRADGVWRLTFFKQATRGQWKSPEGELQLDTWWNPGLPEALPPVALTTVDVGPRHASWPSFAKSSDYQSRMFAARGLRGEPLFCVNDQVCELMFANIVFVHEDCFVTPLDGPDVLAGIGVERLAALVKKQGHAWQRRTVSKKELHKFTSAFAVNAVRGLIPVASIDGKTSSAHASYHQLAQEFFSS